MKKLALIGLIVAAVLVSSFASAQGWHRHRHHYRSYSYGRYSYAPSYYGGSYYGPSSYISFGYRNRGTGFHISLGGW